MGNQKDLNNDYRSTSPISSGSSVGGVPPPIPRRPSDRSIHSPPLPPRRAISSPLFVGSQLPERSNHSKESSPPPSIPTKFSTLPFGPKITSTSNTRTYENQGERSHVHGVYLHMSRCVF